MAKTLTTLRKELGLTDVANTRAIMSMFAKLCETHPDVVKTTFNNYMKSKSDSMQTTQVAFYQDQATYLKELFGLN